jgi:hypothetical protein
MPDKLVIIKGQYQGSDVQFSPGERDRLEVCFNPTEYTVAKKTGYAEAAVPGLDAPIIQFSKGEARTLAIELLLDTCTYDEGKDVRTEYVQKLEEFLMVDRDLHAPPPCKVVWGSLEFVGLVDSLSSRYVMFQDDGTPVRARATVSFKEYLPVSTQVANTPRSSPDRRKVHQFKSGETLWQLAYLAYGDPARWRDIAEANGIDNPRAVKPGQHLVIKPLPHEEGLFANGNRSN